MRTLASCRAGIIFRESLENRGEGPDRKMSQAELEKPSDAHFRQYLALLAPLFKPVDDTNLGDLFEFVCCLVHPSGVEGTDENHLVETTALIDDLDAFSGQNLLGSDFAHPERTRARLALLSYCHLTEGDFFYTLLVNLLRVRCGERWALAPFADLARPIKAKKGADTGRRIPPSPNKKIARLHEYATKAGMPEVSAALKDVYISEIRNAVFHADYTLSDAEFHMIKDYYHSPKGYLTRDVPLPELLALVDRSFAFYYAILNRHVLARGGFAHLRDKAFPFDLRLKGLIEFLFEDDLICGFRVYWPNQQQAQFTRTSNGSHALNMWPEVQGGLNIEVGMYATAPGPFSPLVENGQQPVYTPAPGRTTPPYWPCDGQPVPLK